MGAGPQQPMGAPYQGQWQPPPGGPYPGQGFAPQGQTKGFFGALFDFSFNTFVTPKIVRIVYMIVTVALGVGALFAVIVAVASTEPFQIVMTLVFAPLMFIVYLAMIRMLLELYYAVVRLSEDVHNRFN